jgi:hypothetical protein
MWAIPEPITLYPGIPMPATTRLWDYSSYLSSLATVIDQGRDAAGGEYIVLHFDAPGYTWLSYDGLYDGITEDF